MIDLRDRLTPDELEVWERMVPDGVLGNEPVNGEGPAMQLWSFGYICMLEASGVPDAVMEEFDRLGLDPGLPLEYMERRLAAEREKKPG